MSKDEIPEQVWMRLMLADKGLTVPDDWLTNALLRDKLIVTENGMQLSELGKYVYIELDNELCREQKRSVAQVG